MRFISAAVLGYLSLVAGCVDDSADPISGRDPLEHVQCDTAAWEAFGGGVPGPVTCELAAKEPPHGGQEQRPCASTDRWQLISANGIVTDPQVRQLAAYQDETTGLWGYYLRTNDRLFYVDTGERLPDVVFSVCDEQPQEQCAASGGHVCP